MFLLNLIALGLYEHFVDAAFTDIIKSSDGATLFFAIYFIVLFVGDIKRAS